MKNKKLIFHSLLHALGVFIYILLVATIMKNGEKIFGKMADVWGPLAFLLLFVFSAAITGALVVGQPVVNYLNGQKKEAIFQLFATLVWLLIFLVLIMVGSMMF
jgi:hypothetical protein